MSMPILNQIGSNLRKIKQFLSYESYEGTRKVKEITNGSIDRPILLYEKISKMLRIRPYFLGILLTVNWFFVLWLEWMCNPALFWRTFTVNGLIINFVMWIPLLLLFFYFLPFMKEKYFETVEDLRPIITRILYEQLRSKFVRKRVFYSALLIIYVSILATTSYEIILGFKVGFWTENMPAWSGFRFGVINLIFSIPGAFIIYGFGADVFNGSLSWLALPFLLDKDIEVSAYRDPGILRKVKSFEKFTTNLVNMTLIIVSMMILVLLWLILQPVPIPPFGYVWGTGILFLGLPVIFTSRLRGRAVKKLIGILEEQYKKSTEAELGCEAAKNADDLYETYRAKNDHTKSQEWLKKAAKNYEGCGAYSEAAQRFSKLGNYKRAAVCYKQASDTEENEDYKKYYMACAYTESAEDFVEALNRDKAAECLSLAEIYFKGIADTTGNPHLKNSSIYRSREAMGRLLIFDALKIYENEIEKEKILEKVSDTLTDAQSIFKGTSKVCPGIGKDAETQLKVHALMCEFYKQYLSFKHTIPGKVEKKRAFRLPTRGFWFGGEETKTVEIDEFRKLDDCIKIIQEISKRLSDIYRFKAAKKAEIAELALLGDKLAKQGKNEEAWMTVKTAEGILKNEFGKDINVKSELLHKKIEELTNSIFYTDFPFSAPMCDAVNPDAYKSCIEFENETEVPNEVSRNKDVCFRFRLCYKPCTQYLKNQINVKLKLTHFEREVLKELSLVAGEQAIHQQFLVPAKNLVEGENYIRAELFHIQPDCVRPIETKEFMVQGM